MSVFNRIGSTPIFSYHFLVQNIIPKFMKCDEMKLHALTELCELKSIVQETITQTSESSKLLPIDTFCGNMVVQILTKEEIKAVE